MADKEHLAILKSGVESWNNWRGEKKVSRPKLSGGNLNEADLSGANLIKTNGYTIIDLSPSCISIDNGTYWFIISSLPSNGLHFPFNQLIGKWFFTSQASVF